jgi:hypothetical protein
MQDLAPTLAQRDIGGRPSERAFWYGLKEKQPKPQRGTFDYEFKGTDIGKFRVYGGGIPTGILAGAPRKETGIEKGPGTTTTPVRIPGITEIATPTTIQPPIELQTPTTDITQLFRFSMDNRQVQRSFQQTKNYYTWTTPTYLFSEGPKFGRGVAAPIPYGGGGGGGGYKRKRLWYEQFNVGLDIGFFGNINRLPARSTARKTKKKTSKKRR